jgi:general secretion pathway protein H
MAKTPMSETGSKHRCGVRGFTLIELLVSIAIVALLLGATAANYSKLHQAREFRATVRGVLSGMSTARNEAQVSGRASVFFVDLPSRSYGVGSRVAGHFPASVDVRFTFAEQEQAGGGRGYIRFQPDGGATGGSVDLIRQLGGEGVRLRVDWLLGQISQELISG